MNLTKERKRVKYKGSMLSRGILAGAMVLAGGGAAVAVAATPAGASNTEVTAVGSFTTFFMMHALFPEVNNINPNAESGSETQSIASDSETCSGGITYSTSHQPPNGSGQGKGSTAGVEGLATEEGLAADEQGCIDFSRSSSPPAPNAETLPSTSTETGDPTPSNLDYYAYALDGVAPLVGSDAPATASDPTQDTGTGNGLTLTQVQKIYECVYTNWDQIDVNGTSGTNSPIVLFWPQAGSGTRAVYTDVLGFDPTKPGVGPDTCTTTTQPITSFGSSSFGAAGSTPNEENTEDGIIYQNSLGWSNAAGGAVAAGNVAAAAIYIYSAGKFSQEWNDPADYNSGTTGGNSCPGNVGTYCSSNLDDADLNGANSLGNFLAGTLSMASMQSTGGKGETYVDVTGQAGRFSQDSNRGLTGIDGTTVSEANEWYHNLPSNTGGNPSDSSAAIPGVRYVYNIADTVLPGYNGAKMLIGFDNQAKGTNSVLCNGDDASTITAQGFLPLTSGSGAPSGSDLNGSFCREFPGLAFPGKGGTLSWATPTFDGRSD